MIYFLLLCSFSVKCSWITIENEIVWKSSGGKKEKFKYLERFIAIFTFLLYIFSLLPFIGQLQCVSFEPKRIFFSFHLPFHWTYKKNYRKTIKWIMCFLSILFKLFLRKIFVQLPKEYNKIKWCSIICSHIWHVDISKCMNRLNIHSVKIRGKYMLPNTNSAYFYNIFSDIGQYWILLTCPKK